MHSSLRRRRKRLAAQRVRLNHRPQNQFQMLLHRQIARRPPTDRRLLLRALSNQRVPRNQRSRRTAARWEPPLLHTRRALESLLPGQQEQ
jgi:hypothetical protein